MNKEASSIIVDIIRQQMELPNKDVWVKDQTREIPNDNGLYVVVGMSDGQIYSSSNEMIHRDNDGTLEQVEIQTINARENIQVDIFSRSTDVLFRRWEIITALHSIYAKQQQELYNFKLCRIPNSFVNTSLAEGGSQLNRYSLLFPCLVWYRKERVLSATSNEYFDQFGVRADDANTISLDEGIFEFTIDGDTPWLDEDIWNDRESWFS